MELYRKEKWIYNTYYPKMGNLGRLFLVSPGLAALFLIVLIVIWSYITNEPVPILGLLFLQAISAFVMMFLGIINVGGRIQDTAPIKVKITDEALYFMKSSGQIIKIKLDEIEIVNLRKTIFDGCIVGIMERKDKNTIKHHTFYLSKELGEAIIKKHSKYVEYKI